MICITCRFYRLIILFQTIRYTYSITFVKRNREVAIYVSVMFAFVEMRRGLYLLCIKY